MYKNILFRPVFDADWLCFDSLLVLSKDTAYMNNISKCSNTWLIQNSRDQEKFSEL
jgi:hypothetical protein